MDGEILKGATAADESNLTGEAAPVEKSVGDTVLAGTINLWGAVEVGVLRPAAESSLQKIIHLIREAQHQKAPSQRLTDKFGTGYTYTILALTLVMFFAWWLGFKLPPFESTAETKSAFYRANDLGGGDLGAILKASVGTKKKSVGAPAVDQLVPFGQIRHDRPISSFIRHPSSFLKTSL